MKRLPALNLIFFILVILVNYLANALPLAGNTTGEVSAYFDNLFVPAGYTFSIWGLIYLALGIINVRAVLPDPDQHIKETVSKIGPWLIINFLCNILWLVLWHNKLIGLSMILMLLILFSLISIYMRIDNAQLSVRSWTWWSVKSAFSLYLGWILVASIANAAAFLSFHDINMLLKPAVWLTIMLVIAGGFGVFFLARFKDPVPALVIIWALGGIYAKYQLRAGVPEFPLTIISIITLLLVVYTVWIVVFSPYRTR